MAFQTFFDGQLLQYIFLGIGNAIFTDVSVKNHRTSPMKYIGEPTYLLNLQAQYPGRLIESTSSSMVNYLTNFMHFSSLTMVWRERLFSIHH